MAARRSLVGAMTLAGLCAIATARAQQPQQDTAIAIDTIAVVGAKRYKNEQVVQVSGLKAGSTVRLADIDAAARRMSETGLFNSVSYRYSTSSNRITVTLEIEEAKWTMPVVFDNFVMMSDAQLTAEVEAVLPTFDGTTPETPGARAAIIRVLEHALRSRGLPGTIEVIPYMNARTGASPNLLRVTNPSPRICDVKVPGMSEAIGREMASVIGPLTGTDYSRTYLASLSAGTMLDVYRKRGHWSAVIGTPEAALDAGCPGVTVTLPVTEGPAFQWDAPEWSGHTTLDTEQLSKLLALKAGEAADGSKLDAGVRAIQDAYGTLGHLSAGVTFTPQLSTDTRRVRLTAVVTEGPQFRMGVFTAIGLEQKDASNLLKKWPLKTGDVYNIAAARKFLRDEIVPLQARGLRTSGLQLKPGTSPQTVDVTVTFQR